MCLQQGCLATVVGALAGLTGGVPARHQQEQLAHWRTKIVSNGREWDQRNKTLREEKDIMARHYATLKAAMEAFRSQQNARLKQLSVAR